MVSNSIISEANAHPREINKLGYGISRLQYFWDNECLSFVASSPKSEFDFDLFRQLKRNTPNSEAQTDTRKRRSQ